MIFNIISTLCKEFNITMLTVSSDVKSALKHFKEFIVIDDAKIHWQGSRKEFLKKPTLLIKGIVIKFYFLVSSAHPAVASIPDST